MYICAYTLLRLCSDTWLCAHCLEVSKYVIYMYVKCTYPVLWTCLYSYTVYTVLFFFYEVFVSQAGHDIHVHVHVCASLFAQVAMFLFT